MNLEEHEVFSRIAEALESIDANLKERNRLLEHSNEMQRDSWEANKVILAAAARLEGKEEP